ncbi:MAG: PQQ-dependent sugar dehydrogenase [Rhodothermales bacterium]
MGQPHVLVDGITIVRFTDAPPRSVRLQLDPTSGTFLAITIDGDLYSIPATRGASPQRVATAVDHGITRLQGLAIHGASIYLCGNVAVNGGKGTKGRLVRGRLQPDGSRRWTTVFETDSFGTVQIAFDHGFNAVVVSPDERHLYVTSGSRTDHGEVQDNGGAYPDAREEPLTASVLRVPIDAENLHLPNDLDELTAAGYLYARGIRNAYDMAFSSAGHLFAVSNSGDYDHPEDMFWVREGHHYGFPWVMGGVDNPQQYADFHPDPENDPFINPYSLAYTQEYFYNDPDFPPRPENVTFTPPVANIGPDANYYRDRETGRVVKGDETGVAVGTFTAHRSPLGLVFDTDTTLALPYRGDGFVLSWTDGTQSVLLGRLSNLGADLIHLTLFHNPHTDHYIVRAQRIAEGFRGPVDAELVGSDLYVLEHGGSEAAIWKLSLSPRRTSRTE